MNLIIHPGVRRDVREVLDYYNGRSETAGDRFYQELMAALDTLTLHPERFHFIGEQYRRYNFDKFPYHLIFDIQGDRVRLLVLRHHKRHPAFGLKRRW